MHGGYFEQLQSKWLPYDDEALRLERLEMVKEFFFNDVHRIPPFVERGLYFQSFARLCDAAKEAKRRSV